VTADGAGRHVDRHDAATGTGRHVDRHDAATGAGRQVDWDEAADRYAHSRVHVTDTAAYEPPVTEALGDAPPGPVVDLGAGTGIWSGVLAGWTGRTVVAVEPAAGMRRHAAADPRPAVHHVAAHADRLPLRDGTAGGAWLSAVLHHVGDIATCARELRRVLAPGAPVLIRGAFAGRVDHLPQVHFFPEVRRRFDQFPGVEATEAAFGASGFRRRSLTVVQEGSVDLRAWRDLLPQQRASDTSLVHLSDDEFAAGLRRIDAALAAGTARAGAGLDLLVLS